MSTLSPDTATAKAPNDAVEDIRHSIDGKKHSGALAQFNMAAEALAQLPAMLERHTRTINQALRRAGMPSEVAARSAREIAGISADQVKAAAKVDLSVTPQSRIKEIRGKLTPEATGSFDAAVGKLEHMVDVAAITRPNLRGNLPGFFEDQAPAIRRALLDSGLPLAESGRDTTAIIQSFADQAGVHVFIDLSMDTNDYVARIRNKTTGQAAGQFDGAIDALNRLISAAKGESAHLTRDISTNLERHERTITQALQNSDVAPALAQSYAADIIGLFASQTGVDISAAPNRADVAARR